MGAARERELLQDPGDEDRWVLPGVGSFQRTGRVSRAATAEAGGRRWSFRRVGLVRTGFTATDEGGATVGEVRNPITGRSDRLRWAGRDLRLVRDGPQRRGYALCDGHRRLASMTPRRRGKRQLDVALEDPTVDPGLLLFAAFIAQAHEDDASFPPPEIE